MHVYWALFQDGFTSPKGPETRLRQGGFIDLRREVMACQSGAEAVPKYGQKLNPWASTFHPWVKCQKGRSSASRNVELGFGAFPLHRVLSQCGQLGEVGQKGFPSL